MRVTIEKCNTCGKILSHGRYYNSGYNYCSGGCLNKLSVNEYWTECCYTEVDSIIQEVEYYGIKQTFISCQTGKLKNNKFPKMRGIKHA